MERFAFVDPLYEVTGAFIDPTGQQHPSDWLVKSTPEDRAAIGLLAVTPAGPVPVGMRSTGLTLKVVGGRPVEVHGLEDIPVADRKASLLKAVDIERDRRQQLDFVHDFGGLDAVDEAGQVIAAGERALQMRFDPDQRNWQALQSQAVVAAMAGQGAMVMPMRAEDNWNVQTTAADVLAVTSAMFVRNASILFFGAALKSQVRAALTGSDLDAINITIGWPG